MTIAIKKEDLISALDNGRVRFIANGNLTPLDVDEILRANADRLANSSGKYDIDIKTLFERKPAVKVIVHKGIKKSAPSSCKEIA